MRKKQANFILFNLNDVKATPSPLDPGILFQPLLHPNREDSNGIRIDQMDAPKIKHSTAILTIKPGTSWPETIFTISEVVMVLEGKGNIRIDDEDFPLQKGDVAYIAPGLTRRISNSSEENLVYLSIVDPEWQPETEMQSANRSSHSEAHCPTAIGC